MQALKASCLKYCQKLVRKFCATELPPVADSVPHTHKALAYYHLTPIADPQAEVAKHQAFLADKDFTSRIYISAQGINGQACGTNSDADRYMAWMRGRPEFRDVKFKVHRHKGHIFPRKTIRYRKQLVAMDAEVDLNNTGVALSPEAWRHMLRTEPDRVLVDVRNDYEWRIGHFKGAELPQLNTFREFRGYAEDLKEKVTPDTPIMMYCTGGIRCEFYSAYLREKGFKKVYQLDGGVIGYRLEQNQEGAIEDLQGRAELADSPQSHAACAKLNGYDDTSANLQRAAKQDCKNTNDELSNSIANGVGKESEATIAREGESNSSERSTTAPASEADEFWVGKIFVFDDRLAVPLHERSNEPVISKCHNCGGTSDTYYNCANATCNKLFICCPNCIGQHLGCCSSACLDQPGAHVRKFTAVNKPFRRKHVEAARSESEGESNGLKETMKRTRKSERGPRVRRERMNQSLRADLYIQMIEFQEGRFPEQRELDRL